MHLLIQLDSTHRFALHGPKLEKVVDAAGILSLPRMKSPAIGVVRYQNFLIPIFDFRMLLPEVITERIPLPHLIIFRGSESLNAFPAEALEGITRDGDLVENDFQISLLDRFDLVYQGLRYHRFNFSALEDLLKIP